MPAVNLQISPCHEATSFAEQEYRSSAVFFRLAELAEHILRRPLALTLGKLFEQRLDHGRDDIAGRDGVDADAV